MAASRGSYSKRRSGWSPVAERRVVISCPEHGDLYEHPGAGRGSMVTASEMRPLRDGIPERPTAGAPIECPICGRAPAQRLAVGVFGRILPAGVASGDLEIRYENDAE